MTVDNPSYTKRVVSCDASKDPLKCCPAVWTVLPLTDEYLLFTEAQIHYMVCKASIIDFFPPTRKAHCIIGISVSTLD